MKLLRVPLKRRAALVLCSAVVPACSAPPTWQVASESNSDVRLLQVGSSATGPVRVLDARPAEQKVRTVVGGYVQFGDDMLSPSPATAIQIALDEHVAGWRASAQVKHALLSNEIQLQHFQVLAVNVEFQRRYSDVSQPPGIAAVDALITDLLNSSVGATKVRVIVAFDLSSFRFSSDESKTFAGSPTADSIAQVLAAAMSPIFRRLDLAFQERR
jgi:hypothetical protein